MTTPTVVEAGQVWEHRAFCRLCKTGIRGGQHRHRVLVLAVDREGGRAMVRDLSIAKGARLEPFGRYARPLTIFGSLEKGGMRLAGHWAFGRYTALPPAEVDDRLIDHDRIPLRSTPRAVKLPAEMGIAA